MQPKIIAFVGRAGSGKDYQCSILEKQGYTHLSFAEPIREMTQCLLNYEARWFREEYARVKEEKIVNNITVRNFMENLGSYMRLEDEDYWVKKLLSKITLMAERGEQNNFCISDLRYDNEYLVLQKYAKKNDFDFVCKFCDYHSDRYQEINNHMSAWLSNYLCEEKKLKDGEVITLKIIKEYEKFKHKKAWESSIDYLCAGYSESVLPLMSK